MNKATEMVVGAVGGALASQILELLIKEAKVVLAFNYVSEELATMMEGLHPILLKIESLQKADDLKTLKDTITDARVLVTKCSDVKGWELKKKLLNDSVNTLLVSAPPGCGKTTLVTQLCHDAKIKGKFEHIFFNVVSSTPDFKKLVQNLFQDSGYTPLPFDNDTQATAGLKTLMEKLIEDGPILLVLDDVWHGAESLLKNFQTKIPDYKILVTSRSTYFPDFNFTYQLKPLEDKYAKDLLTKCAPRPDGASQAEYDYLFQKILKRCDGFPMLIEVVGSSLKGQPLHSSFSALKPHLKECFMDMGSFLEDQKICASVIIDIWVELYGKGSSTVYVKYLNDLATRNLLKLIPLGRKEPEDGFYNEFLVTQHDVLRELAICQSKLEDNVPYRKRLLSISTDDLFSSNGVEMDCPNVEALILNISSSEYTLPKFISTMTKLKVVIIINQGFYPARLSNLSCLSSLPNLKRIRMEKVSITFLDIIPLQCIGLKKLSLVMCSFGEVFYDTEEELGVFEAPQSLEEIDIDYCYDLVELPFWISEVVSLKTLSITNCNKLTKLPEDIGNLSKLEVLRVSSCINLSELPEATSKLNNLRFLDISDCLGLKKLPEEIGKLQKLKKISMRKCSGCEMPVSVRKLDDLVVKCDEETGSMWKWLKPKMKNLEVLEEEPEYNLNMFKRF
ncbi:hypothetical protein AALP_AA8G506900 [Arabis alpina]|uniref:RPW8 domain-containing protein n=1 Tax=Arabis alpina TaxID=50452 RepID=A0A087GES1_ARAAL|nr:hypothetical protein AALP_AA8G506900 [Arabis alpina]